jgi:hypothetical protein
MDDQVLTKRRAEGGQEATRAWSALRVSSAYAAERLWLLKMHTRTECGADEASQACEKSPLTSAHDKNAWTMACGAPFG